MQRQPRQNLKRVIKQAKQNLVEAMSYLAYVGA